MSSSQELVTEAPFNTYHVSNTLTTHKITDINTTPSLSPEKVTQAHTEMSSRTQKVTYDRTEVSTNTENVTENLTEMQLSTQKVIAKDIDNYQSTTQINEGETKGSDIGLIGGLSAAGLVIVIVFIDLFFNLRKNGPCRKPNLASHITDTDYSFHIHKGEEVHDLRMIRTAGNSIYGIKNEVINASFIPVHYKHNTKNDAYAVVKKVSLKSESAKFDEDERSDCDEGEFDRLNNPGQRSERPSDNLYQSSFGYRQKVDTLNSTSQGFCDDGNTYNTNSGYSDYMASTYNSASGKDYNHIDSTYDHMFSFREK